MAKKFSRLIRHWYSFNKRDLPWRNSTDPYIIWLSEILLQQTRIDQGLPYFYKFSEKYPNINDLANASEDEVLKLWQGLGYYSRARNLHATAQHVSKELGGTFPSTYKDILALKGVGPYTAAAISSFAFGLPEAVVDGNVIRIISRFFGVLEPFDSTKGKKIIEEIAKNEIDPEHPGEHNQAIMEFGSIQCKPVNPDCDSCILKSDCYAHQNGLVKELPYKSKKTAVQVVRYHFFVIRHNGTTFLEQRPKNGIWGGLYQFPMIERKETTKPSLAQIVDNLEDRGLKMQNPRIQNHQKLKHLLSHRRIEATFWEIAADEAVVQPKSAIFELEFNRLNQGYALPRLIEKFIESKQLKNVDQ